MSNSNVKKVVPTIVRDDYDEFIFDTIEASKKIKELCKQDKGATQDVFTSFYKMTPEINPEADRIHQDVFNNLLSLDEFKSLTAATQIDDVASGLATLDFTPKIIEQLQEIEEQKEQMQQEQKQNGQKPDKNPGLEDVVGEEGMGQLRQEMREALQSAQEKADDWQDTKNAWGMDEGELKQMSYEDKLELADKTMKAKGFRKITELVGRFKNIIAGSKTTVFSHGNDEIVDIVQGSDLGRMLPTEVLKLKMNSKIFYKDLVEGKLLQYNLKQTEELGKGPIICCVDISGSMSGEREELAKAIVLALIQMAEKEKRAFGLLTFDYSVRQRHFWPKEARIEIKEKFKIASMRSDGGGTNFQPPLEAAIDLRKKEPELKPSDVVFITDGECDLSEEFLKEFLEQKKILDMKVFGIAVDPYINVEAFDFCDQAYKIGEDSEVEIIKGLIKQTSRGNK